MINFWNKLTVFVVKNGKFFCKFFRLKYFINLTSVPGVEAWTGRSGLGRRPVRPLLDSAANEATQASHPGQHQFLPYRGTDMYNCYWAVQRAILNFTPGSPGVNFTPRGQNSPLGSKFAPKGEVKNVAQRGVKRFYGVMLNLQKLNYIFKIANVSRDLKVRWKRFRVSRSVWRASSF
jgi:hypothetical protein